MRSDFARAMISLSKERDDLAFLTGDLGYLALEEVAEAFGPHFINAGVAEQNAVSVAAGLAREGLLPWVYSMAAFTVLRPYAQIRDNVCLHRLPVKLVGNGGGYGYGIMGATHHCLEDVGAMRLLPNMNVWLPLVREDVAVVVRQMAEEPLPGYLRLNSAAILPHAVAPFAPWRRIKAGRGCVVIAMGPILQALYEPENRALLDELEIWCVGKFPFGDLPSELGESLRKKRKLITLEEHSAPGGLGEAVSHLLLTSGIAPDVFLPLSAQGYPSGRYGSQRFHQRESALWGLGLSRRIEEVLRA